MLNDKKQKKRKMSAETKEKISEAMKIDREPVISQLKQAFLMGCNITQACVFAGVSTNFYYKTLLIERPELANDFEELRENIKLKARKNVFEKVESGDLETSKWILEKTDKDFNPKIVNEFQGGFTVITKSYKDFQAEDNKKCKN